jgi:hypothetical protein
MAKSYIIRDLPTEWPTFLALCQIEETTAAEKLRKYIIEESKRLYKTIKSK